MTAPQIRLVTGMDLVPPTPARIYRCDVCGKVGPWERGWQWYGSYRKLEEGDSVLLTCSQTCRMKVDKPDEMLGRIESGA